MNDRGRHLPGNDGRRPSWCTNEGAMPPGSAVREFAHGNIFVVCTCGRRLELDGDGRFRRHRSAGKGEHRA